MPEIKKYKSPPFFADGRYVFVLDSRFSEIYSSFRKLLSPKASHSFFCVCEHGLFYWMLYKKSKHTHTVPPPGREGFTLVVLIPSG